MTELVITLLGGVVGALLRHYLNERQWERAKRLAESILADPNPETTSDPMQAMTEAVISVNRRRIAKTSGQITPIVNGTNNGHKD